MNDLPSVQFRPYFQLHLDMRQILSGYLSSEKGNHSVESSVVSVELASRLDEGFPVLRVLSDTVLA